MINGVSGGVKAFRQNTCADQSFIMQAFRLYMVGLKSSEFQDLWMYFAPERYKCSPLSTCDVQGLVVEQVMEELPLISTREDVGRSCIM